ncbi:MAG: RNA-binding cell elongation regulator Jag/EloR [Actinomycetota bacterium]
MSAPAQAEGPGGDAPEAAPRRAGFDDDPEAPEASAEEVAETARGFVAGLLETMDLEADVKCRVEDERALVEVEGEDLGALIGRRGQTLDALQEVTRTAVQRRLRARVRLLVDVEGYRARRRASLADYAQAMARRARERGTEIELEPMNAYERKIVHDAIAEIEGAASFSEGEEPNRKVIVRSE